MVFLSRNSSWVTVIKIHIFKLSKIQSSGSKYSKNIPSNFRNRSIDCTSFSAVTQLVTLRHSRKNTWVLLSKIEFEFFWRITNPSLTLTKWLLKHYVFRLFRDRFNFISATKRDFGTNGNSGYSLNFGQDVICNATRIMARNIHNKNDKIKCIQPQMCSTVKVSVPRLLSRARGLLLGTGSDMLKK